MAPKIIYYAAATLTGHIADEADSLAWLFEVPQEGLPDHQEFMSKIGVLVCGSTTYEWVLREEELLAHPEKWQQLYGERPTFVFTTQQRDRPSRADVRFVSGSVSQHISELSEQAGSKAIWVVGGGDLAGQFFDAGLLDEIVISIAPATLTGGAPVLPRDISARHLTLTDVAKYGQFAQLTYQVISLPAQDG